MTTKGNGFDWEKSKKQALTTRQLFNHAGHAAIAATIITFFLFGFNLPGWAQALIAVAGGFGTKEAYEIGKRAANGEDLHLFDSILDFGVVVGFSVVVLIVNSVWFSGALAVAGAAAYILFKRKNK